VCCSFIYDWSDFRLDTGKLISLHQAHPSQWEFINNQAIN
jgi:hypothetical protein